MRTITGLFANAEAADSAAKALGEAGVAAANIDVDTPEEGETILSATVEDEMVDAAHAVCSNPVRGRSRRLKPGSKPPPRSMKAMSKAKKQPACASRYPSSRRCGEDFKVVAGRGPCPGRFVPPAPEL